MAIETRFVVGWYATTTAHAPNIECATSASAAWSRWTHLHEAGARPVLHHGRVLVSHEDDGERCVGGPMVHALRALLPRVPYRYGVLSETAMGALTQAGEGEPTYASLGCATWPMPAHTACRAVLVDPQGTAHVTITPPAVAPPMMGRETVLQDTWAQLHTRTSVILTGAPGIGKSLLAQHLAQRAFVEGICQHVWHVDAAALHDGASPEALLQAMAQGARLEARTDMGRAIASLARGLFIIDGLETLSPDVLSQLDALSTLHWVVTARHAPEDRATHIPGLSEEASLQLLDACLLPHGTYLEEASLDHALELVRGVQGNPWALRVFGSRMAQHTSLPEFLERLGPHDAPGDDAHPVAETLVAWRWRTLDLDTQTLLCALSVCHGADLETLGSITQRTDLDALSQQLRTLHSQQLVEARIRHEHAPMGHAVSAAMRAFARAQHPQRIETMRARHATHFQQRAHHLTTLYEGPHEAEAYLQYDIDRDNHHAALQWFASHDVFAHAAMLNNLCNAINARGGYWDVLRMVEQAQQLLASHCDAGDAHAIDLHTGLESRAAASLRAVGHHAEGCSRAMRVVEHHEIHGGDPEHVLRALSLAGAPPALLSHEAMRTCQLQGREMAQRVKRPYWEAKFLYAQAIQVQREHSVSHTADDARTLLEQLTQVARRSQNPTTLGTMAFGHALVHLAAHAFDTARHHLEICYQHWHPLDHTRHLALVTTNLGHACLELDDLDAADAWLQVALHATQRLASPRLYGLVLCNQTMAQVRRNIPWPQCLQTARHALDTLRDDNPRIEAYTRCVLAAITFAHGHMEDATSMLDLIDASITPPNALEALAIAKQGLEIKNEVNQHPARASDGVRRLDRLIARLEALEDDIPYNVLRSTRTVVRRHVHEMRPTLDAMRAHAHHLRVARQGEWFELAGTRTDLRRRVAPRRILAALVEARLADRPGLSIDQLFALGWPDDMADPESARARVYVAISTLRKRGLGDVLQRNDEGYLLAPEVPCDVVGDEDR